jgi:hypothetical protein
MAGTSCGANVESSATRIIMNKNLLLKKQIVKKIVPLLCILCALCVFVGTITAQQQTFDITTYTIPPGTGWKKQATENAIQFSKEDAAKGTYCMITLYKSVPGTANAKENFDLAWASLVKEMVTVSAAPEMQSPATENGWEAQSGYAPFETDGNKGVAVLVTSSSASKMVNIIILTNTDAYEKEMTGFLESLSFKKQAVAPKEPTASASSNTNILGTWGATASDNSDYRVKNGVMNYISRQYTFNANSSYSFVSKAFDPLMTNILLGRESGTYKISGNTITITPQKSVLQAWTKKNGGDECGKLINTQTVPVEKATYQFTKHLFTGIQVWNLVLQPAKETKRDGYFSSNTTFSNAYYYAPISFNNKAIVVPN